MKTLKNIIAFLMNQKTKSSKSKSCELLNNGSFLFDLTDTYEELPTVISKSQN